MDQVGASRNESIQSLMVHFYATYNTLGRMFKDVEGVNLIIKLQPVLLFNVYHNGGKM